MTESECEILTDFWPPRIGERKFYGIRDFGVFLNSNCSVTERQDFCEQAFVGLDDKWGHLAKRYESILNQICTSEMSERDNDTGRFIDGFT